MFPGGNYGERFIFHLSMGTALSFSNFCIVSYSDTNVMVRTSSICYTKSCRFISLKLKLLLMLWTLTFVIRLLLRDLITARTTHTTLKWTGLLSTKRQQVYLGLCDPNTGKTRKWFFSSKSPFFFFHMELKNTASPSGSSVNTILIPIMNIFGRIPWIPSLCVPRTPEQIWSKHG